MNGTILYYTITDHGSTFCSGSFCKDVATWSQVEGTVGPGAEEARMANGGRVTAPRGIGCQVPGPNVWRQVRMSLSDKAQSLSQFQALGGWLQWWLVVHGTMGCSNCVMACWWVRSGGHWSFADIDLPADLRDLCSHWMVPKFPSFHKYSIVDSRKGCAPPWSCASISNPALQQDGMSPSSPGKPRRRGVLNGFKMFQDGFMQCQGGCVALCSVHVACHFCAIIMLYLPLGTRNVIGRG